MARVRWFVLMLCVPWLAGCTAPSPDGGDDGSGTETPAPPAALPTEIALPLSDCVASELVLAVDASVVAPHIPDDFALVPPAGAASVYLAGLACGEDGAQGARFFVAIQVEPTRDALRAPGVERYYWEPEHFLVPGSPVADVYETFGSLHANATRITTQVAMDGSRYEMEAPEATQSINTLVGTLPLAQGMMFFGHFREYAAAQDGYVYYDASFTGTARDEMVPAPGSGTTAAGTIARALFGPAPTGPVLLAQHVSFPDARFGYVAGAAPVSTASPPIS